MPFIKQQKNKAYFKRFQVQFRRRREGKTDYRARKRLVAQDKNKYNTPKYRLVVRFSNKDVICQIISSKLAGDYVFTAAYSHELTRYGMPVGHTSYAAAYATGLLLARRTLQKCNIDSKYAGNTGNPGEDYNVSPIEDGPAPFKALLDVGLRRTTTGCRVFAAMKGAVDGGLEVPHSETRFVGFDNESKKLNAEVFRKHIFGAHVADYMKSVKEDDAEKFKTLFSGYIKAGVKAEEVEAKWTAVHKAIRGDPKHKPTPKKEGKPKRYGKIRLSLAQKKDKIRQKMDSMARKKLAGQQDQE